MFLIYILYVIKFFFCYVKKICFAEFYFKFIPFQFLYQKKKLKYKISFKK